jgi:hypothetical protein
MFQSDVGNARKNSRELEIIDRLPRRPTVVSMLQPLGEFKVEFSTRFGKSFGKSFGRDLDFSGYANRPQNELKSCFQL